MTKYAVKFEVELAGLKDLIGSLPPDTEITSVGKPVDIIHAIHPKRQQKSVPKRARASKVNAAILSALDRGPSQARDLKTALEAAGLSPGSLSAGIASLLKAGQIKRVDEGLYGRAA